ncbi:uncharacterized protein LOC100213971 [Hydra vulgaris]|uniref:Uncharacterized protein LOC100213971 n=1 Tax=Hydra vulgaris TaxID=6087 RepID=A0ABM4C0E6_HYDVU
MLKQEKDLNYATAGVPIVFVTKQDFSENDEFQNIFPLPASKYRYSKWFELADCNVTSNMLKNPRIRKPPQGFKVETILMLEDEERRQRNENSWKSKIGFSSKKKDYKSKLENWEQCECINLSYQDLAHPYQMKEFLKILRKLVRAEQIELIENSLTDLSSVFLPKCRYLFLQRNLLQNLKKLPRLVHIEHISLQQNNISCLDGLELLKETNIKSLTLQENPVSLQPDYRKRVFVLLPNLVLLDDLPRTSADYDAPKHSCRLF